jgi:Tetratricopeptide repeat
LNNLGTVVHVQGDYARAKLYYERALAIWEKILQPVPYDFAPNMRVGYSYAITGGAVR